MSCQQASLDSVLQLLLQWENAIGRARGIRVKLLHNVEERESSSDLQLQYLCKIVHIQAQCCAVPATQEASNWT